MITITDSNIFYSALISPKGTTAKILKSKSKIQFITPVFLVEEITNYIGRIANYTGKSKREITTNFKELLLHVKIISVDNISKENLIKGREITKEIDIDDAFFVALHLETGHKIWTGDKELIKGLQKKGYNIFVTTKELQKKLYKKHNNQK